MRRSAVVLSVLLTVLALCVPLSAEAVVLYSCEDGGSGDGIWNGFYIQDYAGVTLDSVSLSYHTNPDVGSYTVELAAHEGSFDGPIIGTSQVTFDEQGIEAQFDFQNVSVTKGSTIAFVQTLLEGPEHAVVYYFVGWCPEGEPCDLCPNVVETEGYDPPLSTFKRGSVDITVTGDVDLPVGAPTWGRMRWIYR